MITTLTRHLCHAAMAGVLLAATPAQAYTYSLDNGLADGSLGIGGNHDILFLNQYTVTPGNNVIGSVSFTVGAPGAVSDSLLGSSIKTVIYSDPNGDGDPSDATLLEIGTGVVTHVDDNVFQTFSFTTPVTLTGASFFVGYLITVPDGVFAGSLDGGSQDGYVPDATRSFFAFDTPGNFNLSDLNANQQSPISLDSVTLEANFILRANTAAVPEPSTYAVLAAGLGLGGCWVLRRRQAAA